MSWRDAFAVGDTTPEALSAASDLATAHGLGTWDAVIVAVASRAGCRLLLTEDLHAGFVWGGVEIVDPFSESRTPRWSLSSSAADMPMCRQGRDAATESGSA